MARRRLTPVESPADAPAQPGAGLETKAFGLASQVSRAPIAQVAGEASATAALEALTDDMARARAEGRMVLDLPLGDVLADHLDRDRLPRDDEDMEALRESLRAHGQRTPIEVTPLTDGRYGLISGWRRLTALSALLKETGDPRFASVRALVRRPETSGDAYVAMVEENEIRLGLSHYERARIVALSADRGVFENERVALRALFGNVSRAKRSKIGSFLAVYRALDAQLRFPHALGERLGLRVAKHVSDDRAAARALRRALEKANAETPEAEQAALEQALTPPKAAPAPEPAPAPETVPGITVGAKRKGAGLQVTLTGPRVDAELHRAILDLVERWRQD
ncbi:hypothetical protein ACW9UR_25040 [Halovulum sp. GXIMD14794]